MEEDDAAAFVKGRVRGLGCVPSAGVDGPRGLGDGEALNEGTAEGDGGSKSVIPSRCSAVNGGI